MDWIQIYFIVMQVLGFGAACHMHGRPREDYSLWSYLFAVLCGLPLTGRILGWW